MKVSQAIKELLFLEDCVIIPGLGGFISQYRPAVIDRATGTFIPPTKEIVFNKDLVQNDGSLVSYIAEKNGISIVAARQMVDSFVEKAKLTLDERYPVYIDGIGQFVQDKGRELHFVADAGTNLFLDSFGLASFHLREVVQENQFKPSLAVGNPGAEIKRNFNVRNFRRIAIAVPFLLVFSLVPYNSRIADTLNSSAASLVPEPSLFRLNYPDIPRTDTAKEIVFPINESVMLDTVAVNPVITGMLTTTGGNLETGVIEEMRGETGKKEEADNKEAQAFIGRFPVIAGCFKIKENADRLHKQLTEKGYPATVTLSRTGYYKVCMESFASREDAISGLARLKRAEPGLELWVAL